MKTLTVIQKIYFKNVSTSFNAIFLNAVFAFCCLFVSCSEESSSQGQQKQISDADKIDKLMRQVNPLLTELASQQSAKEDIEMISFEVVKDLETGVITILNFSREEYFPIGGRKELAEEYGRKGRGKYQVDCTKGGKTTSKECDGKLSCGTAIADCLEEGGCATICKNPNGLKTIREADLKFFSSQGIEKSLLINLENLPVIDLEKSRQTGTLRSVRIYELLL